MIEKQPEVNLMIVIPCMVLLVIALILAGLSIFGII